MQNSDRIDYYIYLCATLHIYENLCSYKKTPTAFEQNYNFI